MHAYRTHTCGQLRKSDVGQTVRLKTEELRFRGEIIAAGEQAVQIRKGSEPVDIPYDRIVRANLIDEGWGKE